MKNDDVNKNPTPMCGILKCYKGETLNFIFLVSRLTTGTAMRTAGMMVLKAEPSKRLVCCTPVVGLGSLGSDFKFPMFSNKM